MSKTVAGSSTDQYGSITWRAIIIAFVLIPVNSYWIARALMVWAAGRIFRVGLLAHTNSGTVVTPSFVPRLTGHRKLGGIRGSGQTSKSDQESNYNQGLHLRLPKIARIFTGPPKSNVVNGIVCNALHGPHNAVRIVFLLDCGFAGPGPVEMPV